MDLAFTYIKAVVIGGNDIDTEPNRMHAQFLFPFYLRCISFESCGFLFHLIHAATLLVATVAVAQRLLSRFAILPLIPHLHKGKLSSALMWRNQIIHGISRTILKKKKFLLFVMRECIAAPLCLLNWSIEYFAFFFASLKRHHFQWWLFSPLNLYIHPEREPTTIRKWMERMWTTKKSANNTLHAHKLYFMWINAGNNEEYKNCS